MYRQNQTDFGEPLMITGKHALLLDLSEKFAKSKHRRYNFNGGTIEDKELLPVYLSTDFEDAEMGNVYTFYNFVLESDGDHDKHYGVWANGVLTESLKMTDYIKYPLLPM
jgi:hypothetical protein